MKQSTEQYEQVLGEWQGVELTKREIEKEVVNSHRSGSLHDLVSPSLSTISGSLPSSPDMSRIETPDGSHDKSRDLSCDQQLDEGKGDSTPVMENNGLSHDQEDVRNGVEESYEESLDSSTNKPLDNCSPYLSRDQSHDQAPDQSRDQSYDQCNNSDLSPSRLLYPHDPEELVMSSRKLSSRAKVFVKELFNIDKDIPRCDRDYW